VSPWLEDPSRARAPLSPDVLRRSARQARCMRFLRARPRVSVMRLVAPTGVATGDASDRLLHSETVPTRALVLRRFPAQRPSPSDTLLSLRNFRGSLSSRSLAAPCSFTQNVFVARYLARPKTCEAGTGWLGAFRYERGQGESRFTARLPLRRPDDGSRGGVFFRRVKSNRPPLTLLSPPPCRSPGFAFLRIQTVARRPPRPVPRGPRERRALCRSGVPSAGSDDAHLARAEARTKPRSLQRRRGAHVMRIAELR
jgi:hypothetical protein